MDFREVMPIGIFVTTYLAVAYSGNVYIATGTTSELIFHSPQNEWALYLLNMARWLHNHQLSTEGSMAGGALLWVIDCYMLSACEEYELVGL